MTQTAPPPSPSDRSRATARAARQLIDQGLKVVPYWSATASVEKPGKSPIYYPENWEPERPFSRVECDAGWQVDFWLRRYPDMNLAMLGVVQVDADDARALEIAGELGVTREGACWICRTRRGYKAYYRPHDDAADYTDVSRPWCLHCPHTGDHPDDPYQLDLLLKAPAIVPPSIHPISGQEYRWIDGHGPDAIPFAELDTTPPEILARWRLINNGVSRPPTPRGRPDGSLRDAIEGVLATWSRDGGLRAPNGRGWINLPCRLDTHPGDDRHPSFGVNFDGNAFNCYVCGSGSLPELARLLHIEAKPSTPWQVQA